MIIDIDFNNLTNPNKTQIVFSCVDTNGYAKLIPIDIDKQNAFRFTNWVYTEHHPNLQPIPGYASYDGKPVSLIYDKRFNRFDLMQFMMSLPENIQTELFAMREVKPFMIDIETQIEDGFPDAETAKTPIVSISVTALDAKLTTAVFTIDGHKLQDGDHDKIQQIVQEYIHEYDASRTIDVRIIECVNEKSMLQQFVNVLKQMAAVSGWNLNGYDIPYIQKRCALHKISLASASPVNRLDRFGLPKHKIFRDYMELFKTFEYSLRPYENFRLDWVANKSLGLRKLTHEEKGLKELRENNPVRFLAYNAIDTIICALLHEKHNLFNVLYGLSTVTHLPLAQAERPANQAEAVMFQHYINKGKDANGNIIVCPAKPKQPTYNYEGGYVKDPVKHFSKFTACFDYSSLYPSLMRTHNLCPTNYIGPIAEHELEAYKSNPDYSVSSMGRAYDNRTPSVYKQVQTELYARRKSFQGQQFFYLNNVFFKVIEEKRRRGLIKST